MTLVVIGANPAVARAAATLPGDLIHVQLPGAPALDQYTPYDQDSQNGRDSQDGQDTPGAPAVVAHGRRLHHRTRPGAGGCRGGAPRGQHTVVGIAEKATTGGFVEVRPSLAHGSVVEWDVKVKPGDPVNPLRCSADRLGVATLTAASTAGCVAAVTELTALPIVTTQPVTTQPVTTQPGH